MKLVICMQRGGPSGMFLLRLISCCTIPQGVSEVFADNISSMHTTQPQLQRVSQVKWVICMQRGGPSGMFCLSACFGMFDFGMFKYCQRSACSIPHTHTCGQVLVLLVVERQGSTAFQPRCAAQT